MARQAKKISRKQIVGTKKKLIHNPLPKPGTPDICEGAPKILKRASAGKGPDRIALVADIQPRSMASLRNGILGNKLIDMIEQHDMLHYLEDSVPINGSQMFHKVGFRLKDSVLSRFDKFGNAAVYNETVIITNEQKSFIATIDVNTRSMNMSVVSNHYDVGSAVLYDIKNELSRYVKKDQNFAEIAWVFTIWDEIKSIRFTESIDEKFVDEAYPSIESIEDFAKGYLESKESILLLTGPPGTGKTRFMRFLLREFKKIHNAVPTVQYCTSSKTIDQDLLFISFLSEGYNFMIVEDADFNLISRKDGNKSITSFLTASDGLISSINKKIIMTTNLRINNIDEALVRGGRCYAVLNFDKLSGDEAQALYRKLTGDDAPKESLQGTTIADIYKLANQHGVETK